MTGESFSNKQVNNKYSSKIDTLVCKKNGI